MDELLKENRGVWKKGGTKRKHLNTFSRRGPWYAHGLRVPLFAVDLGQGVYHGSYFHLFELGREAFFRALDYPYARLTAQGLHLTVAALECQYAKSLHYDDLIEVQTGVCRLGRRSLSLLHRVQRITQEHSPETTTEALMHFVCVRDGVPMPLPEPLRDSILWWMEGFDQKP
ncbi:acyl-CoA thioesterase [Desulfosoma caldarium]|uniref:YbgC/YbaW family acyl-CoA thioester hydrolase n=1 Tax=Desulfosoma caldarium TaxID=610254 RepID=A0A3N1VJI1_9BACT|nr:thioesterase family protein [Desulfosoma caldarium]ROR02976.1 YbgC/YbaW family acyl-CoA thioester hydrolase [Desulfosoma caldarium]